MVEAWVVDLMLALMLALDSRTQFAKTPIHGLIMLHGYQRAFKQSKISTQKTWMLLNEKHPG
jgi:hypothetical protein